MLESLPLRLKAMLRVLGVIIALSSFSKLPPALLAVALGEDTAHVFFSSFALTAALGALLWWPFRQVHYELRLRDGFLIVTLTWLLASLVSSLPFMYAPPNLSFTAAMFEATSGLTTTGATIIVGLDELPKSVLFYRQFLQFIGGMGVVVLSVAILPMLKIGGTQLFRAESGGMTRDTKLTPRIADTAKALWGVYIGLNLLCALAFWAGGMNLFDAVCHAMATISTAGFSPYDASFGHFDSDLLEWIAVVFMLVGGINFGLHFLAWRRATMGVFFTDSELKAFLRIVGVVSVVVGLILFLGGDFESPYDAFRHATFQVVSNITTTGFATTGFSAWSGMAPLLLVGLAIIGGCAGSTTSGLKIARVVMLMRQGYREVKQLVHPRGRFLVKMGGRPVSESVVLSVSGFIALWMFCFIAMVLAMNATGLDILSSFGATVATFANLGPGLGDVASNFADVNGVAVWLGTFGMLLGRLEVFSVLVLLTPSFWRE
ncbi:TrkH family potassium uptake protein [Pseudomarimonas salicorniae]|uniref:Trk system potassium uptake protein n=1 Tax=Pseudomarimonas salicorniae TaxID=2933270 RepID=A0ABT0GE24_9GAMM|nr:potassium transporter [Lysobacter sp. CAU 1642]